MSVAEPLRGGDVITLFFSELQPLPTSTLNGPVAEGFFTLNVISTMYEYISDAVLLVMPRYPMYIR